MAAGRGFVDPVGRLRTAEPGVVLRMTEVLSLLPLDALGAVSLACVFLSMVALGAGSQPARLTGLEVPLASLLGALAVALFAVPLVALLLAKIFGLTSGPLVGLLLMGISPGAPLALKKSSQSGADGGFALLLQVGVALASIAAVPLWIMILSAVYGRPAGLSFAVLAKQVFIAQILPLACGVLLAWARPAWARRWSGPLLKAAGLLLLLVGLLLLVLVAPGLAGLPWTALAAATLLAVAAVALGHLAGGPARSTRISAGVVCALRNPGIALLVASANGLPAGAKIMVVGHVLVTTVVLGLYLALMRRTAPAS